MKAIFLLLTLLAMIVPTIGSEFTVTLQHKVTSSKHVIIGKVISITKTDKYPKTSFGDFVKGGIIIELEVSQIFKGDKEYKNIKIHTGIVSATAGFTGWHVEKGKEFLAYLTEKDGFLTLTGFSAQYFEPIDQSKNEANDIGQTSQKVKLDKKILEIEKITRKSKWQNK